MPADPVLIGGPLPDASAAPLSATENDATGPLAGLRVLEIAAIGPVPFAAMMLADMGARVTRVDRIPGSGEIAGPIGFDGRGRRSIALDLKHPSSRDALLRLVEQSDALIEGFRPGVMERLGLSPDACLARNPALIFGRMTGWGQTGPLSHVAGHDLNYIALSGALHSIGEPDRPPSPPLNLVGDYGGGAMMLVTGILAALHERERSGRGQVIDVAMTDGVAALMAPLYAMRAQGQWQPGRGVNVLDGAAPFYGVYECADGHFISVGAIEPKFYALLVGALGLSAAELPPQMDRASWVGLRQKFADIFRSKPRVYWCDVMEGTDICFAPVLSMDEAWKHPHNSARKTFVDVGGVRQPAPAPRFSRTPSAASGELAEAGQHSGSILADAGFSSHEIEALIVAGAVFGQAKTAGVDGHDRRRAAINADGRVARP